MGPLRSRSSQLFDRGINAAAGRSSSHLMWDSCYAALAPRLRKSFDILSLALASESPRQHDAAIEERR
jgi:hypothetical protein